MHLGGFLVLLGVIFAVLALFAYGSGRRRGGETAVFWPVLVCAAIILIGVGVLVGHTAIRS